MIDPIELVVFCEFAGELEANSDGAVESSRLFALFALLPFIKFHRIVFSGEPCDCRSLISMDGASAEFADRLLKFELGRLPKLFSLLEWSLRISVEPSMVLDGFHEDAELDLALLSFSPLLVLLLRILVEAELDDAPPVFSLLLLLLLP